jgi:hypothetical protein
MPAEVNVGQQFGRLTVVVPFVRRESDGRRCCVVRCTCGSPQKTVETKRLLAKRKPLQSCGCWQPGALKHGHSSRPEYYIWKEARARINRSTHARFGDYGGRGLTIEPAWNRSFEAFWADLGPRPSPEHSLERYDNNKGYVRGNVGWETRSVQARNTRQNHYVSYRGRKMIASDACEAAGISLSTFLQRLRRGWDEESALTKPLHCRKA